MSGSTVGRPTPERSPEAPGATTPAEGEPITHLLYLHGFRSSPRSAKSRLMAAWVAQHSPGTRWWAPQLPPSPAEAIALITAGIEGWPIDRMAVIGSSLGGFYATVMAERLGCRCVLLNPAVDPARDLAAHIGETTAWHDDQRFFFAPAFIDELKALTPACTTRMERYYAVIAKDDEVLDWHEMVGRYPGAVIDLIEGGDHAISDFDQRLPAVTRFLGMDTQARPARSDDGSGS